MAAIRNFYEELNLDQNMSLEDINIEIDRIESTWKMREMSNPEKATAYLELVKEARPVFCSDSSRREYDSKLSEKEETTDDEDPNVLAFRKAINDAISFYDSKQFDIAQVSIEKALGLKTSIQPTDDDLNSLYSYALVIYMSLNCNDEVITYANELIANLPDFLTAYNAKMVALRNKIISLWDNNQDYSTLIELFRNTCTIAEKKAAEQGNTKIEISAMMYLSESYFCYDPKNYDLAEEIAVNILKIDPNDEASKKIIEVLNSPMKVGLDELDRYEQEVSAYVEDIYDMARQISAGLTPDSEKGWGITKKGRYARYDPDNDGNDTEKWVDTQYLLGKDGRFIKWIQEREEICYKAGGFNEHHSDHIEECKIEELMMEMDFEVYGEHSNGEGWTETTHYARNIRWYGWSYRNYRDVKRLYRNKGQGLYNKLKSIIDAEAEYMDACKEINEKYISELEPKKQAIIEEYGKKREDKEKEKKTAVEQARSVESRRNELQQSIESMEKELSSLGFFSGKRKKELQALINDAKQEYNKLESVSDVIAKYDRELEGINSKEKSALSLAEDVVRKKYPLPLRK